MDISPKQGPREAGVGKSAEDTFLQLMVVALAKNIRLGELAESTGQKCE
jgi:hypothetical protein